MRRDGSPARVLERLFGIDARSLAAFRIAVGVLVFVDLVTRARDLEAHYTDLGILPRAAFRELFALSPWHWSIHLWTGSVVGEAVLFAVAFAAAVALVVGWRTRLVTAITWVLLVSLQARNPMILYGADQLLRMLLFGSLFLPLGATWSIDWVRGAARNERHVHVSLATAALLAQPCLMYVFSGLLKQNPSWHSGEALFHALSSDVFATPFGHELLAYPQLLERVTPVVPWFELLVPLVLFVPWMTVAFRVAGIVLLVGFHAALGMLFATGLFQWVAVAGLLPFIPGVVWDRLAPVRASAAPTAAPAAPATRRPAHAVTQIAAACLLAYVVAWNVVGMNADQYARKNMLTWTREWWAAGHSGMPLMFRDYVVERMLGDGGWIGRVAGLHQRWDMFHRPSAEERGWHVVIATLGDGRQISVLEGGRPFDGDTRRKPAAVPALYPSARWATYFTYLRTSGTDAARKLLPPVIAREWNRTHPDAPVENVRIVFVQDGADGGRREAVWYDGPPFAATAGPPARQRPEIRRTSAPTPR